MHTVFDEVLQTIEQILYSPFYHSLDIQLQSDLTDERRASVMEEGRVSRKFLNLIVSSYILKLSDK